ncbi:MAG: ammonium transporter [Methanomicrobiales archaeon HGW-Methanomicrobiales-4]|nr:MAG: ammonium transporter [Methanomicrobiales archaeon HGW-Methanomicrobiales-4]
MAINYVDTGFVLICTAMVIFMTFGVGLFYAGLVHRKNIISMLTLSFISLALVSLQWVFFGYTIAFGPDIGGIIGGLDHIGLAGVTMEGENLPELVFMVFQMAFAAITLAIVTSAVAERIKLSSFLIFGLAWTTLIYDPVAHWVWGGGWAQVIGVLDFAGGIAVHICAGFSALALAFVIGKRRGFGEYSLQPCNIPMTLIGGAILWFGWFGFNAGSALAVNSIAVNAFIVTNLAAAAGTFSYMFISWYKGKPSSLSMISGTIAGLGAITPAAGFVGPMAAVLIGAISGVLCYYALVFRMDQQWDESLDAWAIHGTGGLWGTIAVGIFATASVGGINGLIAGSGNQFILQLGGAFIVLAYSFIGTWILALVVDKVVGLRVSEEEEYVGLDISQHGETHRN